MLRRRGRPLGRTVLAGAVAAAALLSAISLPPAPSFSSAVPIIAGLAAVAAVWPGAAISATALAIPTLSLAAGEFRSRFDWTTAAVLAVIAGICAGKCLRNRTDGGGAAYAPLASLTIVILTSLAVALLATDLAFASPAQIGARALAFANGHFHLSSRVWPLEVAALLLQGLGLFWAATTLTARERTWTVRLLVVSGTAAAAANLAHVADVVLHGAGGLVSLPAILVRTRTSVHFPDVNAAGSYFILPFFAALGLVHRAQRSSWIWIVAATAAGLGILLSGSRAAILAGAIALAFLPLATTILAVKRNWGRVLIAVGAATVIGVALIGKPAAARFTRADVDEALRIRAGMGAAALRAAATNPLFGIGVGKFYNRSPEFMSREMLAIYPRENAHNNYLQILAELGIVGLAAFLWLLYASLAPRRGDLKAFWTQGKWNGLHVGLFVFLVTCLSGHPLLVPEVAYVFWIALGLAAADRQEAMADAAGSSRRARVAAGALCAFVLVSLPIRVSIARQSKNLQDVVFGVSHWRRDAAGVPYRRLAADATFFIPASGTFVEIPLRLSEPFPAPVSVAISFDNVVADRVALEGTDWRRVRLLLPRSTNGKWIRVRLTIEPATAPTVLLGTLDQR